MLLDLDVGLFSRGFVFWVCVWGCQVCQWLLDWVLCDVVLTNVPFHRLLFGDLVLGCSVLQGTLVFFCSAENTSVHSVQHSGCIGALFSRARHSITCSAGGSCSSISCSAGGICLQSIQVGIGGCLCKGSVEGMGGGAATWGCFRKWC